MAAIELWSHCTSVQSVNLNVYIWSDLSDDVPSKASAKWLNLWNNNLIFIGAFNTWDTKYLTQRECKWKENAQDHRFGHAHSIGNLILALVPEIFRYVFCNYVNKLIITCNCHFQLVLEWGKTNESKLLFMRKIFQKKNSTQKSAFRSTSLIFVHWRRTSVPKPISTTKIDV